MMALWPRLVLLVIFAIVASGCTGPGAAGPTSHASEAPGHASEAPGMTERASAEARACDPENPQPEEFEIDPVLAEERDGLAACTQYAHTQYTYVWFVIGRDGHAHDVRVNDDTQGGLARCVKRALGRLIFRPAGSCPTTAEFVIADSPFSRKGAGAYGWQYRPPAR